MCSWEITWLGLEARYFPGPCPALPCPALAPPLPRPVLAPAPPSPRPHSHRGTTSSTIALSLGLYLSSPLHYLPLMASRGWGRERVGGGLFKRFLESVPAHHPLP